MSLRIRSIARLTGIREATLRAWERRYGFPRPERSENGYRTYRAEDVVVLQRVAKLLEQGFTVSEALAEGKALSPPVEEPAGLAKRFWKAAEALDADAAEMVLSEAQLGMAPLEFCDRFLLPLLHHMTDELGVGEEHLASALIRQRLRSLVASAPRSRGPSAVLACPPGDLHEGGLLAVALHLRLQGWKVSVLGADTPVEALVQACETTRAQALGLSCVRSRAPGELERLLRDIVRRCQVTVIAGGPAAAAAQDEVKAAGARWAATPEDFHALIPLRSTAR